MTEGQEAELETRLYGLKGLPLKRPTPEQIIDQVRATTFDPRFFSNRALEEFEGHGYPMGEAIQYIIAARKKYRIGG